MNYFIQRDFTNNIYWEVSKKLPLKVEHADRIITMFENEITSLYQFVMKNNNIFQGTFVKVTNFGIAHLEFTFRRGYITVNIKMAKVNKPAIYKYSLEVNNL